MGKLPTQSFTLLRDGQYVLEIKNVSEPERGEYQGEPTMQVTATLEVVDVLTSGNEKMTDEATEAAGHTYDEWWTLDPKTGAVKQNSKLWQIYEAATGMKLDTDDEIDTDDMVGKRFQAMVVVNKPGTRNRTEHDTYGKAKKKKAGANAGGGAAAGKTEPEKTETEVDESDFEDIPFRHVSAKRLVVRDIL